jgi:hypothetical protein
LQELDPQGIVRRAKPSAADRRFASVVTRQKGETFERAPASLKQRWIVDANRIIVAPCDK